MFTIAMAAMMPMIATTISSSMSVNPRRLGMLPRNPNFLGDILKKRASTRGFGERPLEWVQRDPQTTVRVRPHPRAGAGRIRGPETAPGRRLGFDFRARRSAPHLGRGAVSHAGPGGNEEARRRQLLRGETPLPPHPAAQPKGARGLRDLPARSSPRPRILLPAPGRHSR